MGATFRLLRLTFKLWRLRTRLTSSLFAFATAAFFVLGFSSDARAQIPRAEDGEGLKVGQNTRFHPGFALAFGFDSNVFYERGNSAEPTNPGAYVVPTGWLSIGNRRVVNGTLQSPPDPTGRIVDYNFGAAVNFRQFMARSENLRSQPRLNAGVAAHVALLPGRKFQVSLDDEFYHLAMPANFEAGGGFNFNRITNDGRLGLIGRPGGGRLALEFGYRNQLQYFTDPNFALARNDRMVNGAWHETRWRFLPKSALLVRYSFDFTYYLNCCQEKGTGRNEDNYAHRVLGGFQGQVLRKFVMSALAGWGWGLYRWDKGDAAGPDFRSFIGNASIDYYPTQRTQIGGFFGRTFEDAVFGNYFTDLGGGLVARHQFRWNMIMDVRGTVLGRKYFGIPTPGVEDDNIAGYEGAVTPEFSRRDTLVIVGAKIEQPLARIWAITLRYDLTVDASDLVTTFTSGQVDYAGFTRHLVLLMGAIRL